MIVEQSRIAGISSFGAGGTNAHILVEDYQAPVRMYKELADETVIVLSAFDDDILRNIARRLLDKLSSENRTNIHELAYTLMAGREVLNTRVAFVASSINEVKEILSCIVEQRAHSGLYYGQGIVKKASKNERENMEQMFKECALDGLGKLWAEGVDVSLERIYDKEKPQKISLPTYPFKKEHYFLKRTPARKRIVAGNERIVNCSSLYHQEYSIIYKEEDTCLQNHKIPEAVLLEDMRAIVSQYLEKPVFIIRDIQFKNALILHGQAEGVSLQITTNASDMELKMLWNREHSVEEICESVVLYDTKEDYDIKENIVDIGSLTAGDCKTITKEECYKILERVMDGNKVEHRTIQSIECYDEYAIGYLLDEIQLSNEKEGFNTAILNGAMQSVAAVLASQKENQDTSLLVSSIGEIRIFGNVAAQCVVYITESEDANMHEKNSYRKDLILINAEGKIVAELDDVVLKSVRNHTPKKKTMDKDAIKYYTNELVKTPLTGTLRAKNQSDKVTIIFDNEGEFYQEYKKVCEKEQDQGNIILVKMGEGYKKDGGTFTINGKNPEQYRSLLQEVMNAFQGEIRVLLYRSNEDYNRDGRELLEGNLLFHLSKSLMMMKQKKTVRLEVIISAEEGKYYPEYKALAGFSRSLAIENPLYQYRVIESVHIGEKNRAAEAEQAYCEMLDPSEEISEVRYYKGERYVPKLKPLVLDESKEFDFSEEKAYVITGGLGHLGLVFATYLAKKGCRILLTGRRELSKEDEEIISSIQNKDGQVAYVSADISTEEGAKKVYETAKKEFGTIYGIIHSAGIIQDAFFLKKTKEQMQKVLAPKVYGTRYLDEYFKKEPLDYFIVFSSIAAVFGNVGQTDYSYANCFMQHFVQWRNWQVKESQRFGRTIAINWPLWEKGSGKEGMAPANTKADLLPISEEEGIHVFRQSISCDVNDITIVKQHETMF
jgi:short-subunit dehydrogenase involved in D-alanine esterification of teichoic acids